MVNRLDRRAFLLTGSAALLRGAGSQLEVKLLATTANAAAETVSFGLPLAPGALTDPSLVRVTDENGAEVETAVRVIEPWRTPSGDGSIRSLLLQFPYDFRRKKTRAVTVRIGEKRQKDGSRLIPVADTLVETKGLVAPRVLAVLPAGWLCDSGLAGPQTPTSASGPYAAYDDLVERNFADCVEHIHSRKYADWLFDRTSVWQKLYIRTGDVKYLDSAYRAAEFLYSQTELTGPQAGFFKLRTGDLKYVYPRAMHLHYLLTGDERFLAAGKTMSELWLRSWNPRYHPDRRSGPPGAEGGFWTPRHQGYGLLGVLHGAEMTGDRRYWDKVREYGDAAYEHQKQPPDGRPPDGSWRMNWALYDSDEATFTGGASPWLTDILCDGLFHYWTAVKDPRIPGMIEKWCDFVAARGIHPRGTESYYVVNCFAKPGEPGGTEGDTMESHNLEICHTLAMGMYFTRDARKRETYRKVFDVLFRESQKLKFVYTPRSYNWALQSSGQMIYFLRNMA